MLCCSVDRAGGKNFNRKIWGKLQYCYSPSLPAMAFMWLLCDWCCCTILNTLPSHKTPDSCFMFRLTPREFNSYGSRRGNDAVMARGTFANIRLVNKFMGQTGPRTHHIPSGDTVSYIPLYFTFTQWWAECYKSLLNFRHCASCILGQAFHYSPENAFYLFNQQIYFIIWYLLDRASLI